MSFDASFKIRAALTPSLEYSFELSFVCCKTVLASPIFVDIALLVSLVTDTTLSAKLLTAILSSACVSRKIHFAEVSNTKMFNKHLFVEGDDIRELNKLKFVGRDQRI